MFVMVVMIIVRTRIANNRPQVQTKRNQFGHNSHVVQEPPLRNKVRRVLRLHGPIHQYVIDRLHQSIRERNFGKNEENRQKLVQVEGLQQAGNSQDEVGDAEADNEIFAERVNVPPLVDTRGGVFNGEQASDVYEVHAEHYPERSAQQQGRKNIGERVVTNHYKLLAELFLERRYKS